MGDGSSACNCIKMCNSSPNPFQGGGPTETLRRVCGHGRISRNRERGSAATPAPPLRPCDLREGAKGAARFCRYSREASRRGLTATALGVRALRDGGDGRRFVFL